MDQRTTVFNARSFYTDCNWSCHTRHSFMAGTCTDRRTFKFRSELWSADLIDPSNTYGIFGKSHQGLTRCRALHAGTGTRKQPDHSADSKETYQHPTRTDHPRTIVYGCIIGRMGAGTCDANRSGCNGGGGRVVCEKDGAETGSGKYL